MSGQTSLFWFTVAVWYAANLLFNVFGSILVLARVACVTGCVTRSIIHAVLNELTRLVVIGLGALFTGEIMMYW